MNNNKYKKTQKYHIFSKQIFIPNTDCKTFYKKS